MSFRIDREGDKRRPILRLHGEFIGVQAERLLRQEIVRAVLDGGHVELDVADATAYDSGSLAVIEAGNGAWLSLAGCDGYLESLLSARRSGRR